MEQSISLLGYKIQHKHQENKAYSMCKMKYIITFETSRHLQFILNS